MFTRKAQSYLKKINQTRKSRQMVLAEHVTCGRNKQSIQNVHAATDTEHTTWKM
jgi:hypothetical protein